MFENLRKLNNLNSKHEKLNKLKKCLLYTLTAPQRKFPTSHHEKCLLYTLTAPHGKFPTTLPKANLLYTHSTSYKFPTTPAAFQVPKSPTLHCKKLITTNPSLLGTKIRHFTLKKPYQYKP